MGLGWGLAFAPGPRPAHLDEDEMEVGRIAGGLTVVVLGALTAMFGIFTFATGQV